MFQALRTTPRGPQPLAGSGLWTARGRQPKASPGPPPPGSAAWLPRAPGPPRRAPKNGALGLAVPEAPLSRQHYSPNTSPATPTGVSPAVLPARGDVETEDPEGRPPYEGPGPAPGTPVPARNQGKPRPKPQSSTPKTRTGRSAPSQGTWADFQATPASRKPEWSGGGAETGTGDPGHRPAL